MSHDGRFLASLYGFASRNALSSESRFGFLAGSDRIGSLDRNLDLYRNSGDYYYYDDDDDAADID